MNCEDQEQELDAIEADLATKRHRLAETRRQEQEKAADVVKANLAGKLSVLHELRRRGRKATLLNAIADALVELNLTPKEITARVLHLFAPLTEAKSAEKTGEAATTSASSTE